MVGLVGLLENGHSVMQEPLHCASCDECIRENSLHTLAEYQPHQHFSLSLSLSCAYGEASSIKGMQDHPGKRLATAVRHPARTRAEFRRRPLSGEDMFAWMGTAFDAVNVV